MSARALSRRQAYAEFLLFGNPISMRFQQQHQGDAELVVLVETLEELHDWVKRFIPEAQVRLLDDAEPGELLAFAEGEWAGWRLGLRLKASHHGEPLDHATEDQLRQIAVDHDSHTGREKGGAGIAAGATHPGDVVDQVLAVPLAQLAAMKTARDEVLGEGGGPS